MSRRKLVPSFKLNEKGLARFFGTLEARVMAALWTLEQATVQEVCDQLGSHPNYKTIMTVLNRLTAKGFLTHQRVSHAFVYRPKQNRDEFLQCASRDVVAGLVKDFGNVAIAEFMNVMGELDPKSLATLRALVEKGSENKTR